jgi:hypothetical protein
MDMKVKETAVVISAPKFNTVEILLQGTAPLVVARFSKKVDLMMKMAQGTTAKSKKERSARDYDKEADDARYYSMISACRLVGFKMTLAKLSVFVEADGWDKQDGIPLVRVYGKSETFTAHTRNATGVVDVRSRPMYRDWAIKLRVRFDADQFTAQDVYNLIARVGGQVGLCEGRPDSKSSAGCGFGTFEVVPNDRQKEVSKKFGIK